jgi:hypothetical protein
MLVLTLRATDVSARRDLHGIPQREEARKPWTPTVTAEPSRVSTK